MSGDPLYLVEVALEAYRQFYDALEGLKGERGAITGPLYKQAKAVEKEFKQAIADATKNEKEHRAVLEKEALRAWDEEAFPADSNRLTLADGSWVQVDPQPPELHATDWWALLQNEYVRENLIADVTIRFNKVALAMAEEDKDIPGVYVTWPCKVKIHVEKAKEATNE